MQFRYMMDDNPEPLFPYNAMHLHQGNLIAEDIGDLGGSVLVHIAGKGDLVGCLAPTGPDPEDPPIFCSDICSTGSMENSRCVNPALVPTLPSCPLCDLTLAGAYFCKGGCQGDGRIKGNTTETLFGPMEENIAPSRFCDIGTDNPSSAEQGVWIPGLYSVEKSGNPEDGNAYSPYSIGVEENFDLFCGEQLPFLLDMVLGDGKASYIALHGNLDVIGFTAGESLAELSTTEGGLQNCTIFGNADYTCADGVEGALPPIGAAVQSENGTPEDETPSSSESTVMMAVVLPFTAGVASLFM